MRKLSGIILCLIAPAWVVLSILQVRLLRAGILNTKDMRPFFGDEPGTFGEYLLNVWHWDAVLLCLMISAVPSLVLAVMLLRNGGWRGRITG